MIVVNFSTKEYLAGQRRLKASLGNWPSLMYTKYEEIGSPTHQESPYEFKIWTIERGFEVDDIVLWLDASVKLVGDLNKVEEIIKRDGYFMEEAGAYVDDWCNDHTRNYFNLTEKGMIMFSAGLLGLNLKSEKAMQFFYHWKNAAQAGCFKGDWSNHRHDMTSASIIAQRMGLTYQRGGSHTAYIGPGYSAPEPEVVFHLIGL